MTAKAYHFEVHNTFHDSLIRGPAKDGAYWSRLPELAGEYLLPANIGSVYDQEGNDIKKNFPAVKFFRIEVPKEALEATFESGPELRIREVDVRDEYQVIRSENGYVNGFAWLRYYFGERGAKAEHGVPKNPKPEPWPTEK